MNRYKYLFKNIGLLTISQFGTKLLSFFLVPLYTNILTTTELGTYDLINTTVSLLIPILTLNIVEASLRFSIDKDCDKKAVFSISLSFIGKGTLLIAIFLLVNHLFSLVEFIDEYWLFFFLLFFSAALNGIITYFARGIDRMVDVSVSGVLCSAVMIGLNILFLIPLKLGIYGYFLATIIGSLAQSLYLWIRLKAWNYVSFGAYDTKLKKSMLDYSKPMIANSIAWWVTNVSDRYIVAWMCGRAANGIYSVGYKIPSILNIFQTIFNQAWMLSAVKDIDLEDRNGFFSRMYNLYNFSMVLLCSVLIAATRFTARILYAKDFYAAWKYAPFLLLAIVFGSISGYMSGVFSAVKRSEIIAQSTVVGAVSNLVMNVILVSFSGALGAAIATAISYAVVWSIRIIYLKSYMKIRLYLFRDMVSYFILTVQAVLLLLFQQESVHLYFVELMLFLVLLILYAREAGDCWKSVKKIFHK